MISRLIYAAPQPGDYDPSTGKGPDWGKASPIGLLVILLLAIALVFLLRSFTRHLKKVPDHFPDQSDAADGPGDGSAPVGADESSARVSVPADPPDDPDPPALGATGPDERTG